MTMELPLDLAERPRTGTFERRFPGTDQLAERGAYRDGFKDGVWQTFHPGGGLAREATYAVGLLDGLETCYHDNGQVESRGRYRADVEVGEWELFHEDGAVAMRATYDAAGREHGPYLEQDEDGEVEARGEYVHGVREGRWTLLTDEGRLETTYRHGVREGEEELFDDEGRLAARRIYVAGELHGPQHAWKGKKRKKETVERYVAGVPESLLSGKAARKALSKLAKAEPGDRYDVLARLVEDEAFDTRACALAMHLSGALDLAKEPTLWSALSVAAPFLGSEGVVDLLRAATAPGEAPYAFVPGWSVALDDLVCRAYARDPGPIDAGADALPEAARRGVDFVRARFGRPLPAGFPDLSAEVARLHLDDALCERLLWPTPEGLEARAILDRRAPTAAFAEAMALCGSFDAYADALLPLALGSPVERHLGMLYGAIGRAAPADVPRLLERLGSHALTAERVEAALARREGDDGATMTAIALGVDAGRPMAWVAAARAIVRLAEEGAEIPDALIARLDLGAEEVPFWWLDGRLEALPEARRREPAFVDRAVSLSDAHPVWPRLLTRAVTALPEDARRALLERELSRPGGRPEVLLAALPIADPSEERALWERVIAAVVASQAPSGHGLGMLPARALPLLIAAAEEAGGAAKMALDVAIAMVVARALDAGEAVDPAVDRALNLAAGIALHDDLVDQEARPLLHQVLHRLPRDRAEALLLESLDPSRPIRFARAFRFVGHQPTRRVLEVALPGLLEVEGELEDDAEAYMDDVVVGLASLPEPERWVRWLLESGADSFLDECFAEVVEDYGELLEALEEEEEEEEEEEDDDE